MSSTSGRRGQRALGGFPEALGGFPEVLASGSDALARGPAVLLAWASKLAS